MNTKDCIQEKRSSRLIGFLVIPFLTVLTVPLMLLFPIIGIGIYFAVLTAAAIFVLFPESRDCRLIGQT